MTKVFLSTSSVCLALATLGCGAEGLESSSSRSFHFEDNFDNTERSAHDPVFPAEFGDTPVDLGPGEPALASGWHAWSDDGWWGSYDLWNVDDVQFLGVGDGGGSFGIERSFPGHDLSGKMLEICYDGSELDGWNTEYKGWLEIAYAKSIGAPESLIWANNIWHESGRNDLREDERIGEGCRIMRVPTDVGTVDQLVIKFGTAPFDDCSGACARATLGINSVVVFDEPPEATEHEWMVNFFCDQSADDHWGAGDSEYLESFAHPVSEAPLLLEYTDRTFVDQHEACGGRWSARLQRLIDIPANARLSVSSDDGIRIRLDGQVVFEDLEGLPYREQVDLNVSPGRYTMLVDHFNLGVGALVELEVRERSN